MWSASSCFIRLLWLWCQPHCLVTVDMNLWTACVAGFWGVNGYSGPSVCCYIILVFITLHSPQQTWNSDPFASEGVEAMCSRAQIPGEQHFHQVYLGCHMQGQGLLTDMISLAGGKGTHYPQTVWSNLHTPFFPNSLICLMFGMTNDNSVKCTSLLLKREREGCWLRGILWR